MRLLRKTVFFFTPVVLLFIIVSCHVPRYFWWNFADINDQYRFPKVDIKSGSKVFYFKENQKNITIPLNIIDINGQNYADFESMLNDQGTVAFIIVRNDTIIYENYFSNYDKISSLPSFSVSKSFVSAMIGIAISEGKIKDTSQPVSDYLKDLKDPDMNKISIADLLNMRAGLDFTESYGSPFALMSKYYYGTNLDKYARKLHLKYEPGARYDYQSASTLLLTNILENATGMGVNEYLQEKIWIPLGMESDASWSIDSKKHQNVKSFCCLNARARDFARFGRLYLNKGNWEGRQIVPIEWVESSFKVMNDSRDSQNYPYTYQWRVVEEGAIFAKGVLGQYIYIYPSKNIIIVRFGKKAGKMNWPALFRDIVTSPKI